MRPNQSLAEIGARSLESVAQVLKENAPDGVVVQGDTTTAMCAALAAFYGGIPVAHVEAGLRSDRLDAPFPEEANRRIISQIARWHLAPTARARLMLLRDKVDLLGGKIFITGNTVIDALMLASERIEKKHPQHPALDIVREWKSETGRQLLLVTGHRRENFGGPFREFCQGLADIARETPGALLLYPVHLNPNVQAPVREILGDIENVKLIDPVDYPIFVSLMQSADLIITDSGGVQEEAPALGKPVIVTRDVTERPEAVDAGGVQLVGPHRARLVAAATELLAGGLKYKLMARRRMPFGDGFASGRCLDAIMGMPVEDFRPEAG